jgi:enterochelin esterase family protein
MRVYTPPGYDRGNARYPVMYLFHGAGDWDVDWTDSGNANLILDNLIADGKAKPMIVVMPTIFQQPALGTSAVGTGRGGQANAGRGAAGTTPPQDDNFTRELLQDIMPLVAKKFRILKGPDNTAIAGLSAGGAQALRSGLGHLDTFHYVIGLSSAVGLGGRGRGAEPAQVPSAPPDPLAPYAALLADVPGNNKKLKLFWMSVGKDDGLYERNKAVSDAFLAKGVNLTFKETEGAHWFIVWRRNLRDFVPLLFR